MSVRHYFSIIFLLLLIAPALAYGHSPYSKTERTIETKEGAKIEFIRSYTDGILGPDPVKLVIESGDSQLLETDYGREVISFCPQSDKCFIFLYSGALSFTPDAMYEFDLPTRKSQEIAAPLLKFYGLIAPLIHGHYYWLPLIFLFMAIVLLFLAACQVRCKRYWETFWRLFFCALSFLAWIIICVGSPFLWPLLLALTILTAGITVLALYRLWQKAKLFESQSSILSAIDSLFCLLGGILFLEMLTLFSGMIIHIKSGYRLPPWFFGGIAAAALFFYSVKIFLKRQNAKIVDKI